MNVTRPGVPLVALLGARALSAGGDVLLRIVVLSLLADGTSSTFRIGLILVAPAIGGWAARTWLPMGRAEPYDLLRLGVLIEIGRAVALGLLCAVPSVWAAVGTLVLTGAVQAPFEGAFGVAMQRAHRGANARLANSSLRMGILLVSAIAAASAIRLPWNVSRAAALALATFVGSAATLAWFATREARAGQQSPSVLPAAPSGEASGFAFEATANIYVAAALGLAIAAPSMVGVAHETLASWSLDPRSAYAVYTLAVIAGSLMGGLYSFGRSNDPSPRAVALLGASVGATVWLGVRGTPLSLLIACAVSAFAEMVLAVEVGTRAQLDFGTRECAVALSGLRTRLALVAALGLAINVAIGHSIPPVMLVAVASAIGIVCVALAPRLASSPSPASGGARRSPGPVEGEAEGG